MKCVRALPDGHGRVDWGIKIDVCPANRHGDESLGLEGNGSDRRSGGCHSEKGRNVSPNVLGAPLKKNLLRNEAEKDHGTR